MTLQMVLLPAFVQVGLIFFLMFWMARARTDALRSGQAEAAQAALGAWPARVRQITNAYHNQFQLPLLFLLLVGFAWIARKADLLFVVLSWIFVLLRIAHAVIHTGRNDIRRRFFIFAAGALLLLAMWIVFGVRLLTSL